MSLLTFGPNCPEVWSFKSFPDSEVVISFVQGARKIIVLIVVNLELILESALLTE